MSSPNKIDSLSGLAEMLEQVDMFATGMCAIDRRTFEELREQINALQVICPNHKGVLEARVKWYEFALNSFEECVVLPIENGQGDDIAVRYSDMIPNLLCGDHTLGHFMRRAYLKDSLPRLYVRLQDLLQRSIRVLPPAELCFISRHFQRTAEDLQERLLEGRL